MIKLSQLVRDRLSASIIGISLFLFPLIAYPQDLSQLIISGTEEGSYRTLLKKSGKIIWQARWSVMKTNKDGKEIVKITERGSGKYNDSLEYISWIMESSFIMQDNPVALETVRTAYGAENEEIWSKTKTFDNYGKKLISEQFEGGKLKRKKIMPFPGIITYPSDVLPYILRGFNFESQDPLDFYIFSVEAKLFRIKAHRIGREIIRVPAGEFDSFKIELSLDFGIVNIVTKYFLPKTFMWFSVNEPHVCVKYEGLESGIGSPYVVMELLKFKP